MPGKTQRQHRIGGLLEHHAVSTQEQLVELLSAEGVEATQATVSRDLEELGAVKVRVAGGDAVYALPELPSKQVAPGAHLRRVLGDWVVEVASSLNLVVLRTPPGSAHVVGSALDRSGFHGIVGTVAGDDTVLVIASEDVGGGELAARLSEIAGFEDPQETPQEIGGAHTGIPEVAHLTIASNVGASNVGASNVSASNIGASSMGASKEEGL